MKKMFLALFVSTAALSGAAHAQSAYVGAGITASQYEFDVPGASTGKSDGTTIAGKVFAGYNFDKMWAVEAGYTDGEQRSYSYVRNGKQGNIQTGTSAFYVAGKATMPVAQQVSVFGKLGAIQNRDKIRGSGDAASLRGEDKTSLYAAVGVEYAASAQYTLIAEAVYTGKDAAYGRQSGALSFGARYNF